MVNYTAKRYLFEQSTVREFFSGAYYDLFLVMRGSGVFRCSEVVLPAQQQNLIILKPGQGGRLEYAGAYGPLEIIRVQLSPQMLAQLSDEDTDFEKSFNVVPFRQVAVRPDSHLPEGHHIEAFFKVSVLIRQLRQHLGRQLHPDDLQRAVGSGIFQSATLPGLEDDQILLLGGQHHFAAPEHTAAPHDQKQVIIRAGKEFPNSALFKKITFGCIIHQNSLRGTVRCDSLLYTTEKYNCHNCIIHQFAIVFNHFLDML